MKFQGILSGNEVGRFCIDFYGLEDARMTNVLIEPDDKHISFIVTLEVDNAFVFLLESSFKDGLLHYWRWHKKFKKI